MSRSLRRIRTAAALARASTRLLFLSKCAEAAEVSDFALNNGGFEPSQEPSELHRLARLIAELRPQHVMEIGTRVGGTLLVLCRLAAPDATIISVDLPHGAFGGGYHKFYSLLFHMFTTNGQRLHLLRADSHQPETLARASAINSHLDLLFIDGDHTYEGVKKDFEMYSPMVRDGGLVVFHDIVPHDLTRFPEAEGCAVDRFWQEIKSSYRSQEIVADWKQGWAGIGVLYK